MQSGNHSTHILNNFLKNPGFVTSVEKMLNCWNDATKEFIKEHPSVFFTRADKGNVTAMNKDTYRNKMIELLSDSSTYVKVTKDPTKSLTSKLRNLLIRWKNRGYIGDAEYKSLLSTDGILPRAYGLPKIHKQGCPLRVLSCLLTF